MKRPIEQPQWFKDLSEDALLNSAQVAALFGYVNANSFLANVRRKGFPPATATNVKLPSTGTNRSYYGWSKQALLGIMKRRNINDRT